MGKKLTQQEYIQKIYDKYGRDYELIGDYVGMNYKVTVRHKCGLSFKINASRFINTNNVYCYCQPESQRFNSEINSVYVLDKNFASLFENIEETKNVSFYSANKTNFICPHCNSLVKNKRIADVYKNGLCCPFCSDNISLPERIMYSFLSLNSNFLDDETFHMHKVFDWSKRKEYDFYFTINGVNYIVETHGEQHYIERPTSKICLDLSKQVENDKLKKDLALNNNISEDNYIIIDCRYSDFNYIKNNIINSKLNNLFDLEFFDWNKCLQSSATSLMITVCNLWNSGVHCANEIMNKTKLSYTAVYKFLSRGKDIGLCDYSNIVKTKVRCVNDNIVFDSITEAGEFYKIKSNNISAVCRKLRTYCGVHPKTNEFLKWEYV